MDILYISHYLYEKRQSGCPAKEILAVAYFCLSQSWRVKGDMPYGRKALAFLKQCNAVSELFSLKIKAPASLCEIIISKKDDGEKKALMGI